MEYSLEKFLSLQKGFDKDANVRILSSSMEPFIYKGDRVVVSPKDINTIQKGDVIVYWDDNKLICHMFLGYSKEDPDFMITKGLNRVEKDNPIHKKFYLGVITSPKISGLKKLFFRLILSFQKD